MIQNHKDIKKLKRNTGITLVALTVTIIVILILASIGIAMITRENSMIRQLFMANETKSLEEARERIESEVLGSYDRKGKLNKEKLKQRLKDDLEIQKNQIVDANEGDEFNAPLEFPLENYDIEVQPNGDVNIIPNGEIPTPPELKEGDIIFIAEPQTLTNKPVKVTIEANVSTMRLTLQYAKENPDEEDNWQTYEEPVTMNDNGPIYARLTNEIGENSNYTTGNINNIDKVGPTIEEFKVIEETPSSTKVTVNANDDRQLASKDTYKFFSKEEGTEEYKLNGTSTENEYTYKDLTPSKNYELKVIVTDEAGNTSEKTINNVKMEMPELNANDPQKANITFKYSNTEWNNLENVNVTIDLTDELKNIDTLKLQYRTPSEENTEWQDYQQDGFQITKNGSIYARLIEKEGIRTTNTASSSYTKFDREQPELSAISITNTTTNSISVSVTATDKPEDNPSGLLDENAYTYIIYETANAGQNQVTEASNEPTHKFTGLTQEINYTIKVMVSDKAKNVSEQQTTQITKKVPDLTYGKDITFTYNPDEWTNSPPVNVTLNPQNNIDDGFTLQYGILSGETSYIDESTTTGNQSKSNYWKNSVGEITDSNPLYSEETYFLASRWMNLADIGYCSWGLQAWANGCLGLSTDLFGYWPANFSNPKIAKYRVVVTLPSAARYDTTKSGESANEAIPIIWSGSDGTSVQSASLEVGQYIDYIPEGKSTSYLSQSAYNGAYDQRLNREELHWRILSIDENVVKIISDVSSNSITYQGAAGYNNAVKDLNDMCEALYSHGSTKARSVNLEDFKGQPGVHQVSGEISETPSLTVPAIWNQEIDGGGVLGQSESPRGDSKKLEWYDYYGTFPVQENGVIYARLKEKDGEQVGESAQSEMELIDVDPPTGTLKITNHSTGSLSVEVENADDELSGLHETEAYTYSIYKGENADSSPLETKKASNSPTAQFSNLSEGETYTIKVIIKDKAGNTSESTVTNKLVNISSLDVGKIVFNYNTNNLSNAETVKVKLTADKTINLEDYKLQYSTDYNPDGQLENWQDYTEGDEGFTVLENGTIYARLIEKNGTRIGGVATSNYIASSQ